MRRALITSALPYANGEIHLGHVASTYLPADITARFLRMSGVEAYYVCASDDFGTPILIQSEKEGKAPADYVAHWNRRDREDFGRLGISFDYFSGTSSDANVRFVQDAFRRLDEAGHIYRRDVVQFYCAHDEKFLPDRYVRGTCPHCSAADQYSDLCEACGRIPDEISDPRCALCGRPPEKRTTEHHFFRLGGFADRLSGWLEGNGSLQRDVVRYVQNWIRSGLEDWDVTRDIPWGVPVPGADGRVFYGWFDNHLAYISSTLKFLEGRGIDGEQFWNSAEIYHFIGKDIIYHHYLFLPAMRMGLGRFKLPDRMPVRGHLTFQSRKLSKSKGWYIGLADFMGSYPADYLRYYLASMTPYSQDDLNFDWDDFAARINSELIGNLGNFVNRALGFAKSRFDGRVPDPGGEDPGPAGLISGLARGVGDLLEENHIDRALRRLMEFSAGFNQYFQHAEPWKGGPGAARCVYYSVNAARSLAIASSPFIPFSAQRIWAQLGLEGDASAEAWDGCSEVSLAPGHLIGDPEPLFARVEADDIGRLKGGMGR
ncbi:MAG: methionine--tRNA ligase [Nitrosopumilus sp.]|nr:methionine--tRNA ligase [Nitrosopumilus sp.]MDA7958130.1 methionine--tRNA ligase [Nitrosopumilus sp.]